jgi:hypothetical protein
VRNSRPRPEPCRTRSMRPFDVGGVWTVDRIATSEPVVAIMCDSLPIVILGRPIPHPRRDQFDRLGAGDEVDNQSCLENGLGGTKTISRCYPRSLLVITRLCSGGPVSTRGFAKLKDVSFSSLSRVSRAARSWSADRLHPVRRQTFMREPGVLDGFRAAYLPLTLHSHYTNTSAICTIRQVPIKGSLQISSTLR